MPIADYAHWNEEAHIMWWLEEGRHVEEAPEFEDDPDAGWGSDDWEDFDDEDEIEAPAVEDWYREDLGWGGGFD